MGFQYKKVLLIGATSGIGAALADTLVQNGVFVIVVGRRRERLEDFVKKAGQQKADHRVHDVNDPEAGPKFVQEVFHAHPDIDFVYLNAGVQRALDFTKPETVDLDTCELELKTNYNAPVYLTKALLPYLTAKSQPTAIAYTTSQMAIITLTSRPNYGASKAALHSFIIALRRQLSQSAPNVSVIEVYPPAVQTELHDSKNQPDLKNGDQIGMPLAEFNNELWQGLSEGKQDIAVGTAKNIWEKVEPARLEENKNFNDTMDEALKEFLA
ncbi:short-chain dehydrogenase oxidoreductase [Lecanosticta acicola]|uniref:Short-chain dehydrogenase oxidoreductase n=1 Tax=Lecanosticta acicola TaxID=111012 RepID=A0AAI9EB21_9PEZI|nr:short-chain dehydrogenase oxidoreductase [Lecanosticta acicola]